MIKKFKKLLKRLKKKKHPITSKKVKFSYKNEEVLRNINLCIKEKKISAIVGKSGSGKSTFLKLIAGVISRKHGGKIKIFGRSKSLSKEYFGFITQENSFIPDLSLEDNIRVFGLNEGITEKDALIRANKLMELLKLEVDLNKKPNQLSGGQKTRLNIILSMLHDPKIIILDEPFTGLDFRNRRLLWHFLEKMNSDGKTIILTSHLLAEIQEHVDRIIILKDGKIFFNGKLDSLKKKLKINYVYEVRFSWLAKEKWKKLKKYCIYDEIEILEKYEKYIMFSLSSEKKRKKLDRKFKTIGLNSNVISFREPNLDEIFLRT
ncbi:MAG: ABC transporter ATP-binding protein [Candidatus Woesearchaeota archaeon]